MLRKKTTAVIAFLLTLFVTNCAIAQDSSKTTTTVISGSVDVYYRYNFANAKDVPATNNATSFTNSQNSLEFGMASVKLEHNTGKVSGVIDLGFGTRAQEFSYNDNGIMQAVKQVYVTYAPSSKVKFTMGKFGTHVGYELLDPQLNRNYSMSYMFSYGPFFHTGFKVDVTPVDNIGFMLGVANPTDFSTASFENKFFLGQFHAASKNGNISGYLNYVGGKNKAQDKSSQFDVVVTGKVSDKFNIGYNGTTRSFQHDKDPKQSFWGSALYLNFDPTSMLGLTLRGEYFDDKKNGTVGVIGTSIFAATLSADIKIEGLTIIPEFRIDNAKDNFFVKNDGTGTKSLGNFILAAIYHF